MITDSSNTANVDVRMDRGEVQAWVEAGFSLRLKKMALGRPGTLALSHSEARKSPNIGREFSFNLSLLIHLELTEQSEGTSPRA
jgi:hypothetical protein